TIQSALVIYPLTVKGAVIDDEKLRRTTTASLLITCLILLPAMLLGLTAASATGTFVLGLACGFALITCQLQEVVRRALMAHFRYFEAAWGDALRYLGTAACVCVMWRMHALSLPRIFVVIGAFSALAVVTQALQVGPRAIGTKDLRELLKDFWHSGRWMLF